MRFIIQTDHNNLRWIEASLVPKIIRWTVYLQPFDFMIKHIAGKRNVVADALSRLLMLSHVWDSGISDDDPNALWRKKQLLFPPFRPDDPPTLTRNGVFDDFNVSAKEIQAPTPSPMNFEFVHNSTDIGVLWKRGEG